MRTLPPPPTRTPSRVVHALCSCAALALGAGAAAAQEATFDDLPLDPETYWNGSDESGSFTSGGFTLRNSYNPLYGSWSGFAYSNTTDTTTPGYGNQYSAIAGGGVFGANYAVSYVSGTSTAQLDAPAVVPGVFVTNTTYAYLAMRDGDDFAKKFGGWTANDPDWFLLTITGKNADGQTTGSVDFYLADFRSPWYSQDYILDSWEYVDLSSLGAVSSLEFALSSSDMGAWGMNTPAYFALDNLGSIVPPLVGTPPNATLDDLGLPPESYWNGDDESGSFSNGGIRFPNAYNSQYGSWQGFAYSSMTDTTTPGYGNQYSAIPGTGAHGTDAYAVCFAGFGADTTVEYGFTTQDGSGTPTGLYVTNTTYAYLSMRHGDDYAKKFGGDDGTDPDWFRLTATGHDADGQTTGTVDFYLADFRYVDSSYDYIVDTWQWMDLSPLGTVASVSFSLSSSDVGPYGMNTPAYFALDSVNGREQATTTAMAPAGVASAAAPTFEWPGVTGAEWYYIWVAKDQWEYESKWTRQPHTVLANDLEPGAYTWYVYAWGAEVSEWSSPTEFTYMVPPAPTAIEATENPDNTVIAWESVPTADWYYLWLFGPQGTVVTQWFDQPTFTAAPALADGEYEAWIVCWNPHGLGPQSRRLTFTVGQ